MLCQVESNERYESAAYDILNALVKHQMNFWEAVALFSNIIGKATYGHEYDTATIEQTINANMQLGYDTVQEACSNEACSN